LKKEFVMDCQEIKPTLLDYLFEEAPAETRAGIERHLKSCVSCSEEMAELKQTMGLVVSAEVSEDIPRRIRMVAEPQSSWLDFWRMPSRLAFASAAFLCLAIGMLSLFRTHVSYQNGNFQIAFGAPAVSSGTSMMGATLSAGVAHPLNRPLSRDEVNTMISDAVSAAEARQDQKSGAIAKNVSDQVQQRWQHDLQDMTGNLRYFQAAQNMMWKEQVQNQQLVSTLMHQSGPAAPAQQQQQQ
jgi:hypothetical protein